MNAFGSPRSRLDHDFVDQRAVDIDDGECRVNRIDINCTDEIFFALDAEVERISSYDLILHDLFFYEVFLKKRRNDIRHSAFVEASHFRNSSTRDRLFFTDGVQNNCPVDISTNFWIDACDLVVSFFHLSGKSCN